MELFPEAGGVELPASFKFPFEEVGISSSLGEAAETTAAEAAGQRPPRGAVRRADRVRGWATRRLVAAPRRSEG